MNSKSAISNSLTLDEPGEPAHDAGLEAQVRWLVQTRAYLEIEHKVVRIYDTSLDCRVTPPAFEMRYRSWFELVQSGKHQKPLYAAKCWEGSPARLNVEGVQMRPDMPFPLYVEGGRAFKNTYRKPVHPTEGGEIATFLGFMQRFLPDERERTWLLTWMAHKQARPEIPGSAVIFVADNVEGVREGRFGTGRGLLFRVAHALYGQDYARTQSFNVLDGTSSQSAYNDWMHGSVLITVDESRTSPTAYRRGERNAVYDVLKDIVDPAPKVMSFKGKYKAAFNGTSFCSYWVATNHADAVAIPAADRRFTVLRNGREITPAEAIAFDAWMVRPENIGALARYLAGVDLTGFNMFEPLATTAKDDMADLARTEVEEILDGMMGDDTLGLAFTRHHMMERISLNFKYNSMKWTGEFEAAWSRYCVKVLGPNGSPRRVRVSGTQRKLFCFRTKKFHVDGMPEAALRREAAKWGLIDGGKTRAAGLVVGSDLSEKSEPDQ